MEGLDIVCGEGRGRMSRIWRKRMYSGERVQRRAPLLMEGLRRALAGRRFEEGGILVAGETVPLSPDEK